MLQCGTEVSIKPQKRRMQCMRFSVLVPKQSFLSLSSSWRPRRLFVFRKPPRSKVHKAPSSPFLTLMVNKALHFQHLNGPWKTFLAMKKLLSVLQEGHLILTCMRFLLPFITSIYRIMPNLGLSMTPSYHAQVQ